MRAIWPGALLVVYLSATALLLASRPSRVGGWAVAIALHMAGLLAVAAATWVRATPPWVRAWTPLVALLGLYAEMPMLIAAAGHTELRDATVMAWAAGLFGGQPAVEWAVAFPSRLFSEMVHLAYLAYYPIIFAVPVALFRARRQVDFSVAVFVLLLTFVVCFASYIAFPVAGPRYAGAALAPDGPIRSIVLWLLESGSSRGTAFPSSHVAVAVTQSLLATRYLGWRAGLGMGAVTAGLATGAVYGGFHYAIDVVAGAAVGVVVPAAAWGLSRWRHPVAQAKAMAPT